MWIVLRVACVLGALAVGGPSAAGSIEVPSIASDAWLRTGPSTSHERITGLPRGTAVLEIADAPKAFERLGRRWVFVHVLEGRAEGRQGWVWGELIGCCEDHEWLARPTQTVRASNI